MTAEESALDEGTQELLERAAKLADIDAEEITVEQLVQLLAESFIEEQENDNSEELQQQEKIAEKQEFFQERILENI